MVRAGGAFVFATELLLMAALLMGFHAILDCLVNGLQIRDLRSHPWSPPHPPLESLIDKIPVSADYLQLDLERLLLPSLIN